MDKKLDQNLIKKILVSKKKPEEFKDLSPSELAELVLVVLGYVKDINTSIEQGKLKGKDATPLIPDKDYITYPTAIKEMQRVVNEAVKTIQKDALKIMKGVKNGENGKDAKITKEQIEEAGRIAYSLIQLPDFPSLITQEPTSIRDSLELLSEDERLTINAISGWEEIVEELQKKIKDIENRPTGSTGGSLYRLRSLLDVDVEGATTGQVLTRKADGSFHFTTPSGGSGAVDSVNGQTGVVVLDADDIDDTSTTNKFVTGADITKLSNLSGTNTGDVTVLDGSEIDFTLTGQQISASLIAGSIDESKLDASVNASLDLADSALQAESDTLATVTARGATTTDTVTISPSGNNNALNLTGSGSGVALNISHSGSGTKLSISDSGTGDLINAGTGKFVVTDGGSVGIGTVSPGAELHVVGDASSLTNPNWTNSQLRVSGHTNPNLQINIGIETSSGKGFIQAGEAGVAYRDLILNSTGGNVGIRNSSPTSTLTVGTGQVEVPLGSASLPAYSFTGDLNTGVWSPTADTYAVSTGGTERFRVTSAGRVGIGTTSPSQSLHVSGSGTRFRLTNTSADPVLEMEGTSGVSFLFTRAQNWHMRTDSTTKHVKLQTGDSNGGGAGSQGWVQIGNGSAADPTPTSQLTVRSNQSATTQGILDVQSYAGTSILFVKNDLTVGMGTSSPSAKLHAISTTEQFRSGYDTSNYWNATTGSTGAVTFDAVGSGASFTFSDDVSVPDEAYGAGWNGSLEVPTKNAVYDKIETIVAGSGFTWNEVTGTSQTASVNNGYIANNASLVTITLPTTAPVGSVVRVTGKGAGGWRLAQNASEQIIWNEGGVDGTDETTIGTGGYLESTDDYDAVEVVCITADTTWVVVSSKGNINLQ